MAERNRFSALTGNPLEELSGSPPSASSEVASSGAESKYKPWRPKGEWTKRERGRERGDRENRAPSRPVIVEPRTGPCRYTRQELLTHYSAKLPPPSEFTFVDKISSKSAYFPVAFVPEDSEVRLLFH